MLNIRIKSYLVRQISDLLLHVRAIDEFLVLSNLMIENGSSDPELINELAKWISDLRTVVKVALADNPQQLERMGIPARTSLKKSETL